jgi:hypothetical protein
MWKLIAVCLEILLVSVQDRHTVCAKRSIGSEIIWIDPMVLLGDEAQVKAGFGPFGDSANHGARQVHGLHQLYHMLGNHFRCT